MEKIEEIQNCEARMVIKTDFIFVERENVCTERPYLLFQLPSFL